MRNISRANPSKQLVNVMAIYKNKNGALIKSWLYWNDSRRWLHTENSHTITFSTLVKVKNDSHTLTNFEINEVTLDQDC